MGDPKKQRKKYSTPSHPWQAERIEEEKSLLEEYGLKNKREIWKMKSLLKKFSQQAKKLIASSEVQAEIEKKQLIQKLISLGLIEANAHLEDILAIATKNILERRLQTIVYKRGFSRSIRQARQFITHRHVVVNGKLVTFPSYLVKKSEEDKINFVSHSPFTSPDHPERIVLKSKEEKQKKARDNKQRKSKGKKERPKKEKKNSEEKKGDVSKESSPKEKTKSE